MKFITIKSGWFSSAQQYSSVTPIAENMATQGRNFGLKSGGYQFRKSMGSLGPEAKGKENGEKVFPSSSTLAENGFIVHVI